MDKHELISFLRSMARMQAEMPEQYAKMLGMLGKFRAELVTNMVSADSEKNIFRLQGGVSSIDQVIEKLSTPSQDLQDLEKS